tara:strand:- start:13401 stop:13781 length:381 start_codon:yes stop_codon:yes gene_type:complete
MSLEYALITDSSLPEEVKGSEHYISVDKKQWLDLIDYSEGLVESDSDQRVLFLIVAKGTPEQEAEDKERKRKEKEEWDNLYTEKSAAENALLSKEQEEKNRLKLQAQEKSKLREKSESIFNALYRR